MDKIKLETKLQCLYNDAYDQMKRLDEGSFSWDTDDIDNWQSIADNIEHIASELGIELKEYNQHEGEEDE